MFSAEEGAQSRMAGTRAGHRCPFADPLRTRCGFMILVPWWNCHRAASPVNQAARFQWWGLGFGSQMSVMSAWAAAQKVCSDRLLS